VEIHYFIKEIPVLNSMLI